MSTPTTPRVDRRPLWLQRLDRKGMETALALTGVDVTPAQLAEQWPIKARTR